MNHEKRATPSVTTQLIIAREEERPGRKREGDKKKKKKEKNVLRKPTCNTEKDNESFLFPLHDFSHSGFPRKKILIYIYLLIEFFTFRITLDRPPFLLVVSDRPFDQLRRKISTTSWRFHWELIPNAQISTQPNPSSKKPLQHRWWPREEKPPEAHHPKVKQSKSLGGHNPSTNRQSHTA